MKKLIFSVHEKYQVYRLSSGRTAQRYSSVWMKIILDAKNWPKILNGPQGNVASKTAASMKMLKGLEKLLASLRIKPIWCYQPVKTLLHAKVLFREQLYFDDLFCWCCCFCFRFFFFLVSRIEKGKLKEVVWLETRHLHAQLPSWALNGAMAFTWLLKVGQRQWIDSYRRCGAWMRGKFPMRGN